ncbi:MAG: transcription antitermination factor NusB [Alphaproteobacteria bacterium]|nr:transcription antitermination factor NusB [Alphaproteobacteria bacterium]
MASRREIRELALQALYQLDVWHGEEQQPLDVIQDDAPVSDAEREQAMALARGAWALRDEAEVHITDLAPAWPTARQPAVDRAILRLAFYEMASGHTPARAAVNEAIELAKRYSTERSPAFINGVLDKIMRRLAARDELPDAAGE